MFLASILRYIVYGINLYVAPCKISKNQREVFEICAVEKAISTAIFAHSRSFEEA